VKCEVLKMETIEWSSMMRNRSRTPQLLVLSEGKLEVFQGKSIPGKVVVTGSHYKKNGKWSGTTYQLVVGKGTILVDYCRPFDGWGQTWSDLAMSLKPLNGEIDAIATMKMVGEMIAKDGDFYRENIAVAMKNEELLAAMGVV
jgi:hypothetical protein